MFTKEGFTFVSSLFPPEYKKRRDDGKYHRRQADISTQSNSQGLGDPIRMWNTLFGAMFPDSPAHISDEA